MVGLDAAWRTQDFLHGLSSEGAEFIAEFVYRGLAGSSVSRAVSHGGLAACCLRKV